MKLQQDTNLIRVWNNWDQLNIEVIKDLTPMQQSSLMQLWKWIENIVLDISDPTNWNVISSKTYSNVRDAVNAISDYYK